MNQKCTYRTHTYICLTQGSYYTKERALCKFYENPFVFLSLLQHVDIVIQLNNEIRGGAKVFIVTGSEAVRTVARIKYMLVGREFPTICGVGQYLYNLRV